MEENRKNNKTGRKVGMVLSVAAAAGLVFGGTSFATREVAGYLVKDTQTEAEQTEVTQNASAEATEGAQNLLANNNTAGRTTGETTKPETEETAGSQNSTANTAQAAGEAQTLTNVPGTKEMSVADVSEYVMPSMVAITNTSVETLNDYFGNYGGMDLFGMFGFGGGFGGYGNGGNGGDQTFVNAFVVIVADDMASTSSSASAPPPFTYTNLSALRSLNCGSSTSSACNPSPGVSDVSSIETPLRVPSCAMPMLKRISPP